MVPVVVRGRDDAAGDEIDDEEQAEARPRSCGSCGCIGHAVDTSFRRVGVSPTRFRRSKTRPLSLPPEERGQLTAIGVALVFVEWVGLELVLVDLAAAAEVERRDDRAGAVHLDTGREGVGTG